MPFTMALEGDAYHPAADCDRCGRSVPAGGFVLWRLDADAPLLVTCGDDCFEALWAERAGAGQWAGAALDAYLARLVQRLGIDVGAVLAREEASAAAERTRGEAPD